MNLSDKIPLVSVILCVFNGENQVSKAIDDILAQTYENFELIISDDASTDRTAKILENYRRDTRVRIYRHPKNLGFVANKNFAISMANGELITQQDHDDRSDKTRLKRQVDALTETGMLIVACGVRRLSQNGNVVGCMSAGQDMVLDSMPKGDLPFFFAPIMFNQAIWAQHGPLNEYFTNCFGEDLYFISCVLRTHPIAIISDCLYDYVDTPASVTSRLLTKRAMTLPKILPMLLRQNEEFGTNDLEQGCLQLLADKEKKILLDRQFVAERYRTYAVRAVDHLALLEAVKLIIKAFLSDPFSRKLPRTSVYLFRRFVGQIK